MVLSRQLSGILISGFLVSLIPLLVANQNSTGASLITTILFFLWYVSIFVIGISSVRAEIVDKINPNILLTVLVADLMLPYLISLGFGLSFNSILIYLLWLCLPTILLIYLIHVKPQRQSVRMLVSVVSALLFWIGFDHRYTMVLFDVFNDLSYIMNAFWIASLMMIGYGYLYGITYHSTDISGSQISNSKYDLTPTVHGLKIAQVASISASVIIVPVGLLTGFLIINPQLEDVTDIIIGFVGIYLTIALQEELIFRGIILNELDAFVLTKNPDNPQRNLVITLVLSSFMFGLTHWNNEVPAYVPHYIILATVAGIAYGWSFRRGGLFGAILSHTLVDWFWSLLLQR